MDSGIKCEEDIAHGFPSDSPAQDVTGDSLPPLTGFQSTTFVIVLQKPEL